MSQAPLLLLGGADGAGKSTQAEALAASLRAKGHPVALATIWDLVGAPGVPFRSKADVVALLGVLSGPARASFLASAMHEALARVPQEAPLVIWVAGWRKYHATELALGTSPDLLDGLAQGFPAPQLSIHLDLAPEAALARKSGVVSGHESGGRGAAGFVAFQRRVAQCLEAMDEGGAQPALRLDGALPQADLARAIAQAVEAHWPSLA